jgi:hypothetical protein
MSTDQRKRSLSYVVLCASLVAVTVVFGVRVKYTPDVYYAIAGILFTVICFAAWNVGASAIRADVVERRRLAMAGALLITPWALFSFLAGVGPPGVQTVAENELRYLILLINAMAVAGGLVILKEALSDAGERLYSTLGFAALMIATPLYLVWATIMLSGYRAMAQATSGEVPSWLRLLSDPSDILLFFGGLLTYLATAAFAASMGPVQWLGRKSVRAFVTVCIVAMLCLVLRGLQFPDPAAAATHWYTIPGFVAGIPAIPWIMPCLFGIILLRRAGDDRLSP